MQKAADHFNIDYRTIQRHLDTNIITKQNEQLLLLFSNELTEEDKKELFNNINKAKNAITSVWIYKKIDNQLILINENKPTYTSKLKASQDLSISSKTITKVLDTNKSYKDLFFFSEQQH
jgi:hypothetical protein